jgi:hypothetical protein
LTGAPAVKLREGAGVDTVAVAVAVAVAENAAALPPPQPTSALCVPAIPAATNVRRVILLTFLT